MPRTSNAPKSEARTTRNALWRTSLPSAAFAIALPTAVPSRKGTLRLTPRLTGRDGLPLVVLPLSGAECDFNLGVSVGEVQRQRHQSRAGGFQFASDPVDFAAIEQQLAASARGMIGPS